MAQKLKAGRSTSPRKVGTRQPVAPEVVTWDKFVQLDGAKKGLKQLLKGEWLTDEIVDQYMLMIGNQRQKTYVLPHHYSKTSSVKDLFVKHYEVESLDNIYVPIASENHWYLIVVFADNKSVDVFDSLPPSEERTKNHLENYSKIVEFLKPKIRIEEDKNWETGLSEVTNFPEQLNSSDCGVFMLACVEHLSRGENCNFEQDHMDSFRLQIFNQIKNGRVEPLTHNKIDKKQFKSQSKDALKDNENSLKTARR